MRANTSEVVIYGNKYVAHLWKLFGSGDSYMHNTDMNGKIYGALVQFGCYQHRYEWKDLWCSSTVRLLSA